MTASCRKNRAALRNRLRVRETGGCFRPCGESNPSRTAAKLRSLASVYPNIRDDLSTTETTQSGTDHTAHDRAALEILHTWSADPAFQPIAEHLRTMIVRLDGFIGSPNSNFPPER